MCVEDPFSQIWLKICYIGGGWVGGRVQRGGVGGATHAQELVDSEKQSISIMQLFNSIRSLILYMH